MERTARNQQTYTREDITDVEETITTGDFKRVVPAILAANGGRTPCVIKFPRKKSLLLSKWVSTEFDEEPWSAEIMHPIAPKHVPEFLGTYQGRRPQTEGYIFARVIGSPLDEALDLIELEDLLRFREALERLMSHGIYPEPETLASNNLLVGTLPGSQGEQNIVMAEARFRTAEEQSQSTDNDAKPKRDWEEALVLGINARLEALEIICNAGMTEEI